MTAITSKSDGKILLIRFMHSRILDETQIRQVAKELLDLLDKTEEKGVILDFRGVGFMSSSMLGTLIRFHKKCKEYKVQLRFCNIDREILQVFKMTRLDKVFSIHCDLEDARASLPKGGVL